MKMIYLRLSHERREVALNPDKVLYVTFHATGSCSIHFGKESLIHVEGELHEIIARIEGQLKP